MVWGSIVNSCVMTLAMHWLTLWATAGVLGHRARHPLIFLGAVTAGLIDAAIVTLFFLGRLPVQAAVPLAVLSILPAVRISFGPLPTLRFLAASAHVLGISLLAFGGATTAAYLTGWKLIPALFGLIGTVLLTTEIGWGYVHRRVRDWLFYVPIEIRFGDTQFRVNALLDTGNRLKDPLTGSPVILLEYSAAAEFLPEEVRRAFMAFDAGDLGVISELLANSAWLARFRVIPFASLGTGKGLLPGFRADEVRVLDGGQGRASRNVVIGIHMDRFSREGAFRALLHPDILAKAS